MVVRERAVEQYRARRHGALIQRQYADKPPFVLTPLLHRTFKFRKILRKLSAERFMKVRQETLLPTIVVATDGCEEDVFRGAGGLLLDVRDGSRWGIRFQVTPEVVALWPAALNHIQRVECMAIVVKMVMAAESIAGRSVLWCIDNASALGVLVKGQE